MPPAAVQDGTTPLFAAAACGAVDAARVLLQHSADAKAVSKYGSAALHDAAAIGSAELVALLLQHGADAK